MAKINTNLIKTLQYNGKNYRVWDDTLKGFGISIQQKSMSFILQYRNQYGQQKYYTIGRVGVLTADEARKIAKDKLAGITKNEDPASERQDDKNTLTINQLCDWYLKSGIAHKKPKTIIDNISSINNHIKPLLGNTPIKTINRGILESFIADVTSGEKIKIRAKSDKPRGLVVVRGGKFAAKKALELLSAMFEFAIAHDKIDKNPAHGVKTPAYNTRDVFLDVDEIRKFGELLSDPVVYSEHTTGVNALKLLLLTGCRKSEITTLKWEYIDFNEQCFRFPDTKTGPQTRVFGLGAKQLLEHLQQFRNPDSPFVFPAARQSKDGHLIGLSKMFKSIITTTDENGVIPRLIRTQEFKNDKVCQILMIPMPWPAELFQSDELRDRKIKVKITLSYFVDPNPSSRGYGRKFYYQSHNLRFDLQMPTETEAEFMNRINANIEEESDERDDAARRPRDDRWTFGKRSPMRTSGSIHQDILTTNGAELANMKNIAIYSVGGWWRDSKKIRPENTKTRFSLIVSIDAGNIDVDLYTPIKNIIQIENVVEVRA